MMLDLKSRSGRINISLIIHRLGQDCIISITGGDRPHIGVVYIGCRDGIIDKTIYRNHKEEEIVNKVSMSLITGKWFDHFVVIGGIHLDDITLQEINEVNSMCDALIGRMEEYLNN